MVTWWWSGSGKSGPPPTTDPARSQLQVQVQSRSSCSSRGAGLAAEGAAAGELQPSQLRQALAQTQLSTEKTFSANFRGVLILRYQGTKLVWLISKEALTYALTVFPVLVEPSHCQL